MSDWQIGARFVCERCWTRSAAPVCTRCGRTGTDVGLAGWEALAARWRGGPAFLAGASLISPRAIPRLRILLSLALVAGAGCALAPIVAAIFTPGMRPLDVAIAFGIGVVAFPIVTAIFGVYFLFIANLFRVLAVLVALVPTPLGFGRRRVNLVSAVCDWIAKQLLAELVLVELPPPTGDEVRGTLAEPLRVHFRRDSLSFVERFDAWIERPLALEKSGGGRESLEIAAGTIAFPPTLGTRERVDPMPPPRWTEAPGRPGVARVAIFPAGTSVTIRGGNRIVLG